MAIYCEDLFKLSSFRDARLRGGRTGLGRKITWPYVGATKRIPMAPRRRAPLPDRSGYPLGR